MMDLARDLLDVQLLDPRQRPIGRVSLASGAQHDDACLRVELRELFARVFDAAARVSEHAGPHLPEAEPLQLFAQ